MKPRSGKKKKGGRKKKAQEYQSKYPKVDYEKLKTVPKLTFVARMNNTKGSDAVEGSVPLDYSFHKIKEIIQAKHGNSCSNLRLYILEGQDKKYLDNILCRTFKELGISTDKFTFYYEFDPFVSPMLEASLIG